MDLAIRGQILKEAVCISYSTNTLEKGMNPTVGKYDRLGFLILVWQSVKENENLKFKPVLDSG